MSSLTKTNDFQVGNEEIANLLVEAKKSEIEAEINEVTAKYNIYKEKIENLQKEAYEDCKKTHLSTIEKDLRDYYTIGAKLGKNHSIPEEFNLTFQRNPWDFCRVFNTNGWNDHQKWTKFIVHDMVIHIYWRQIHEDGHESTLCMSKNLDDVSEIRIDTTKKAQDCIKKARMLFNEAIPLLEKRTVLREKLKDEKKMRSRLLAELTKQTLQEDPKLLSKVVKTMTASIKKIK